MLQRVQSAAHRWHWTLDETNPDRVAIREYSRNVGRDFRTITDMVHAYGAWVDGGTPIGGLPDAMERAKLRGDTLLATEAFLLLAQGGPFPPPTV